MFQTISNFMRVGDIRRKIIFTLLMLIVFRIGTFIPVPNVNAEFLSITGSAKCFWSTEYIWRWRITKLLNFCYGNYALHHSFDYYPAIADGCST